jgi:hypothetical protein
MVLIFSDGSIPARGAPSGEDARLRRPTWLHPGAGSPHPVEPGIIGVVSGIEDSIATSSSRFESHLII